MEQISRNHTQKNEGMIVPAHGSLRKTNTTATQSYSRLLLEIENHAPASKPRGISSNQAAKRIQTPHITGRLSFFRNSTH